MSNLISWNITLYNVETENSFQCACGRLLYCQFSSSKSEITYPVKEKNKTKQENHRKLKLICQVPKYLCSGL